MPSNLGPDPCPACGSHDVVHVVYGMPTPDGMENLASWEIMGGCVIFPESPTRRCNSCGNGWASIGQRRTPDVGADEEQVEPRRAKPPRRLGRRLGKRSGPAARRCGGTGARGPRGRLVDLSALLDHAGVEDIEGLAEWITDTTELDAFVHMIEDGDIAVGFDTRGAHIEFPTTVSEFWESVNEVEDEVIAAWEAAYEAEERVRSEGTSSDD